MKKKKFQVVSKKRKNMEYQHVFIDLHYTQGFVKERTNTSLDIFKIMLIRFESNIIHKKL